MVRTARTNGMRVAVAAAATAATAGLLAGCFASPPRTEPSSPPSAPAGQEPGIDMSEPPNVGDAKNIATAYHDGGAYQQDLAAVGDAASSWLRERADQVERPAIVFDIDDTALTNWEVIKADDFGRVIQGPCTSLPEGPCGWRSWDLGAHDTPIVATLGVYDVALDAEVAVFFITGRDEGQRAATVDNLDSAGYGDYAGLLMPATGASYGSAAEFKAPQRAEIEKQGYMIIANVGDQPSDLEGGHSEKTFLLPNPFYRIP